MNKNNINSNNRTTGTTATMPYGLLTQTCALRTYWGLVDFDKETTTATTTTETTPPTTTATTTTMTYGLLT